MIAAIIVTHNRLQKLQECLHRTCQEPIDRILVVDNASQDGTRDFLATYPDKRVAFLCLPVNKGGAGGFAAGFTHLLQDPAVDWLLCYDDDAYPAPGAIATFRSYMPLLAQRPEIVGIASAVYYPDHTICEMNRPSWNPFATWRRLLSTMLRGRMGFHIPDAFYATDRWRPIDCCSFVGLFIRAEAARRYSPPRGELFLYGDDILYTYGLSSTIGDLWFAPRLRFIHHCQTLVGDSKYTPLWKAFYTFRNGIELYRTLSGPLFPVVCLWKALRWFAVAHRYRHPLRYCHLVWCAVVDGVRRDFLRPHEKVLQWTDD
ncbi:MAG: glycosyltransferase [Planctomycetota bacterium]|nr:glycosyltransferase [Planctomycetota bacterium]